MIDVTRPYKCWQAKSCHNYEVQTNEELILFYRHFLASVRQIRRFNRQFMIFL